MQTPAKAPHQKRQKRQKPKQSGWDRLLPGCLAEAGRGGPASEPFFTGGLLACSTPRLSDFPRKLGGLVLPWAPVPVPWEGEPGMEAGGRLFLNLSSACPHVLHHEVLWAAGAPRSGLVRVLLVQGVLEHRPLTKLGKPKQRKT